MVDTKDIINSVDRALDILIYLHEKKKEMTVSEIARDMNVYKSTVFRTLKTLENKGFVKQNPENEKYWLGTKIYAMGLVMQENFSLVEVARPYIKELSNEFREVVNMSILDQTNSIFPKSIIVHKEITENQVLSVNPNVGSSTDCHCSSVGKCLLAFSSEDVLQTFQNAPLKKYTPYTITDWITLNTELDDIRVNGYALDEDEQEVGLSCIGAPIFDRNNHVVAAISISGPTHRVKDRNFLHKIQRVKETAAMISKELK